MESYKVTICGFFACLCGNGKLFSIFIEPWCSEILEHVEHCVNGFMHLKLEVVSNQNEQYLEIPNMSKIAAFW